MSKEKNIVGEVLGEFDLKLHMEAMMGKMRRILRLEMEQVHKRIDRIENSGVDQPQSSNWRRREKVQPRSRDRRSYVEDEYDVRRQEKCTPIFIENILRGFDCVIERQIEIVEKENKKKRV